MKCSNCNKQYKEEDLDLHLNKWLCHDCEEHAESVEILRALDNKIITIYKVKDIKIAAFSEKQALFLLRKDIYRENSLDVGII